MPFVILKTIGLFANVPVDGLVILMQNASNVGYFYQIVIRIEIYIYPFYFCR